MGDNANYKRKNKSNYRDFKKRPDKSNLLDVNLKGFVVTCNFQEKKALMECYNILNTIKQSIDKDRNSSIADNLSIDNDASTNVDDDLKKELNELKSERPFKQTMTDCKNVLFVKVNDESDPIELMNRIFESIEKDQAINCRFICKMIPIIKTTQVAKQSILSCLTDILNAQSENESTFKIEITTRINDKLKKDELIKSIAELVKELKPNWKAEMKEPKKLIYIDIIHKICGLSILDNYFQRNKFNLNLFCKTIYGENKVDEIEDESKDVKNDLDVKEDAKDEEKV